MLNSGTSKGEKIVKKSKQILIVDDDILTLWLLEAVIEHMGYKALVAHDGFEALAILSPEIDLILLDIVMPGLDGFEVIQRIRCGDSCQDVPIIVVSGLGGEECRKKAERLGANDFVSKPIDRHELQPKVTALLNVRQEEQPSHITWLSQ